MLRLPCEVQIALAQRADVLRRVCSPLRSLLGSLRLGRACVFATLHPDCVVKIANLVSVSHPCQAVAFVCSCRRLYKCRHVARVRVDFRGVKSSEEWCKTLTCNFERHCVLVRGQAKWLCMRVAMSPWNVQHYLDIFRRLQKYSGTANDSSIQYDYRGIRLNFTSAEDDPSSLPLALTSYAPFLSELDVTGDVSDLNALCTSAPNLEKLRIRSNRHFINLSAFTRQCKQLHSLAICRCVSFDVATLSSTTLRVLMVNDSQSFPHFEALRWCGGLSRVELEGVTFVITESTEKDPGMPSPLPLLPSLSLLRLYRCQNVPQLESLSALTTLETTDCSFADPSVDKSSMLPHNKAPRWATLKHVTVCRQLRFTAASGSRKLQEGTRDFPSFTPWDLPRLKAFDLWDFSSHLRPDLEGIGNLARTSLPSDCTVNVRAPYLPRDCRAETVEHYTRKLLHQGLHVQEAYNADLSRCDTLGSQHHALRLVQLDSLDHVPVQGDVAW